MSENIKNLINLLKKMEDNALSPLHDPEMTEEIHSSIRNTLICIGREADDPNKSNLNYSKLIDDLSNQRELFYSFLVSFDTDLTFNSIDNLDRNDIEAIIHAIGFLISFGSKEFKEENQEAYSLICDSLKKRIS